MDEYKKRILAHFVLNNKIYSKKILFFAPRIGDEIRFGEDDFCTVKRFVWALDEHDQVYSRANIEIEKVSD